jgi:hypothetical protein
MIFSIFFFQLFMDPSKKIMITEIKNALINNKFKYSIYYRIFCNKESTSIFKYSESESPLFIREFRDNDNITHDKILEYLNIVKVEKGTYYYSAYPKNIEKEDFLSKYICWMTVRLDQALIHPLERNLENPVFFKFKLKKDIYLLNSTEVTNNKIFNKLFSNIDGDYNSLLNNLKNVLGFKNVLDKNIFERMNNKYILYIIEAINEIINEECSDSIIINGYKNDFDQKEIALLNFKDLVDESSIVKYEYTKIIYKGEEINLANGFLNSRYNPFYVISKPDMYRMRCDGEDLKLYYKNDDEKSEHIFDCNTKEKKDFFYAGKYKKYKQKYLELKRFYLNKK